MPRLPTELVHAGAAFTDGAVVGPIHRSANYLQDGATEYSGVRYLRLSNSPQQNALHTKLARIEGAEAALSFSSGMAAISTTLLSLLSAGDHLLIQRNVYGGTATFLHDLKRWGISHTAVDATRPKSWSCPANARVFYVESVSNPLMEVGELEAVVAFCKAHNLIGVIDNTFLSPVQYRPLDHGFDLVVHSATKYLAGHSDLVAGTVAGSAELLKRILHQQSHLGGSLDPAACFLLDRGLKTLHLRVPQQAATALALAQALEAHPRVRRVRYPGLESDPNHRRARAFCGHGGMLSFELEDDEAVERLVARLKIPTNAASLGGVESLVVRPSRSTHLGMSPEARGALGITDQLVRVSVGVEDRDDLLEDFARALSE